MKDSSRSGGWRSVWAPTAVGAVLMAGFAAMQVSPALAQLPGTTSGTSTKTKAEAAAAIPSSTSTSVSQIPKDWVKVPPSAIVDVVAAQARTCALNAANEVWCWGQGISAPGLPRLVLAAGSVKSIWSNARDHMCAVSMNGDLGCWSAWAPAVNREAFFSAPQPPYVFANACIAAIDGTGTARFARMSTTGPMTWGRWHPLPNAAKPSKLISLTLQYPDATTGTRYGQALCAIGADTTAWCGEIRQTDCAINAPQPLRAPGGDALLRGVVAGDGIHVRTADNKVYVTMMNHTVALVIGSATAQWGSHLGLPHFYSRGDDTPAETLWWVGGLGEAGLAGNGVVYEASAKPGAQRVLLPEPEQGPMTRVRKLAVAHAHACALLPGGTVACWGRNGSGELGRGFVDNAPHARPAYVYWPPAG